MEKQRIWFSEQNNYSDCSLPPGGSFYSTDYVKKKKNVIMKKNLHSLSLTLLSFPYPLTVWLEFTLNNA